MRTQRRSLSPALLSLAALCALALACSPPAAYQPAEVSPDLKDDDGLEDHQDPHDLDQDPPLDQSQPDTTELSPDAEEVPDLPELQDIAQELPTCYAPLLQCGDRCVDIRTDNLHCGGCNEACEANAWCLDAQCHRCPEGYALIPPGTFLMGSHPDERGHKDEEAQREVTLKQPFCMANTEVSQQDFISIMGYNPSFFSACGDDCPVHSVTWHEAAAYCNIRSHQEEVPLCYDCVGTYGQVACTPRGASPYDCRGYRLPTEAEWEYAARAGSTTALPTGNLTHLWCDPLDPKADALAWYCGNAEVTYHGCIDATEWNGPKCSGVRPGAEKAPNPWGLFDMHGNVWEWVHDWYGPYDLSDTVDPHGPATGTHKVQRGGSWAYTASDTRSAARGSDLPSENFKTPGFRPVIMLHP